MLVSKYYALEYYRYSRARSLAIGSVQAAAVLLLSVC